MKNCIDMKGSMGIGTEWRHNAPHKIRIDIPYICYETDIFTVFKAWNPGHTSDYGQFATHDEWWDPFLSLDRERIQHAGLRLWGITDPFDDTVTSLGIDRLPALRTLSLFMLGPDPGLEKGIKPIRPGWVQMSPLVLQRDFYFEMRDISPHQLEHHPMFRDSIISRLSITGPLDTPFRHLVPWAKAWLWHFVHRSRKDMYQKVSLGQLGPDYMMDKTHPYGNRCPLDLFNCKFGFFRHSRADIWDWNPYWEIKPRFLCEKEWMKDLERVGLFDENRTIVGDFDAFYKLRQDEIDGPTLRTAKDVIRMIKEKKEAKEKRLLILRS